MKALISVVALITILESLVFGASDKAEAAEQVYSRHQVMRVAKIPSGHVGVQVKYPAHNCRYFVLDKKDPHFRNSLRLIVDLRKSQKQGTFIVNLNKCRIRGVLL